MQNWKMNKEIKWQRLNWNRQEYTAGAASIALSCLFLVELP